MSDNPAKRGGLMGGLLHGLELAAVALRESVGFISGQAGGDRMTAPDDCERSAHSPKKRQELANAELTPDEQAEAARRMKEKKLTTDD